MISITRLKLRFASLAYVDAMKTYPTKPQTKLFKQDEGYLLVYLDMLDCCKFY